MHVKGIPWAGTRTPKFREMADFVTKVLGCTASKEEPDLALFTLPNGDLFQVFGPTHPGGGHPESGVVAGFLVDDAEPAREELKAAGVEVSELDTDGPYKWAYFRAPDDNLYEIFSGPGQGT